MQLLGVSKASTSGSRDRRARPRFELRFPVLFRKAGESWKPGRLKNISGKGALILTNNPFLVSGGIEYVVGLPSELTKANRPVMIRFSGMVLRSETRPERNSFGMASESCTYKYLPAEDAAGFEAIFQKMTTPAKE